MQFFDNALDKSRNEYKTYRNKNLNIKYIDKPQPPSIIKKNYPKKIQERINSLCKNDEIFNVLVVNYQNA